MLVVTSFYAALSGIMCVVLGMLVIRRRRSARIALGDGGDAALGRLTRAFGNFVEYAALALLLLALVEVTTERKLLVHMLGAAFVASRIAHAIGLTRERPVNAGRTVGMILTFLSILGSAIALLIYSLPKLF